MRGTTPTAALIGALTLLATGFPTTAAAQTSAAPLRQQEPMGILTDRDEKKEVVARALDEAELEVGRTIHVDVVVGRYGRRVSTDLFAPVSPDGIGRATEVPMPVLAEDVDAPDGIVVLVDPVEGTGSFVEAHGLENRLARPRPLPLPSDTPHRLAAGRAASGAAMASFAGGTAIVVLLLGYFLKGEGYRGPQGPDKGVGFLVARRDAEALLATLAPRVMLLAEKETAVIARPENLGEKTPNGPNPRRKAEGLLREVVPDGFWEDFATTTSLAEEDPEKALPELRRLSTEVEAALGEAEKALRDPRVGEGPGGDMEHLTRRDGNDG